MLSVRPPKPLESQLAAFCNAQNLTKSAVVQLALEKHLSLAIKPLRKSRRRQSFFRPARYRQPQTHHRANHAPVAG